MEQEEQRQENGFEVAATGGPTARINCQNQPTALHFFNAITVQIIYFIFLLPGVVLLPDICYSHFSQCIHPVTRVH